MSRPAAAAAVAATGLLGHTLANLRALRIPVPRRIEERVSVLVPARDEAATIVGCLHALLASEQVAELEVLVCDDGSTDATAALVEAVAAADERVRLLPGAPLPAGWLGKPHACQQLADAATGTVLVFVDADVRLVPTGLAATVALLRDAGLGLVSPYPRQEADGLLPRLVQPLLQWSWLTFLPLRLAERSPRPSLCAANGQLLACDAAAYRQAGGHAAVRDEVIEDLALARAVKAAGHRVAVADGTGVASCRMYADAGQLVAGYRKSLWAAFGSAPGAAAAAGLLAWLYLAPPAAAARALARGRPRQALVPGLGYAAGVAGRALVARRTGGRPWDAPAHPLSIAAFCGLLAASWWGRWRGTLSWRGRRLG